MKLFLSIFLLLLAGCVSVERITFAPGDDGMLTEEKLSSNNVQSINLVTSDNLNIHALYLPDDQSDILTIYFHGNGGNIHQRAGVLDHIRSLGSSVLGLSYRGYLNSAGTPSEKGVYKDGEAALDHAVNVLGYPKENIVLLGRSMGSGVAIELANNHRLGSVILVSPFTNPREMLSVQRWLARLMVKDTNNYLDTAFQNSEKVLSLKTYALVVHGTEDEIVPYRQGKKIFDLIPGDKQLLTLTGAKHNDFGYTDSSDFDKQYWTAIQQIFRREY